MFIKHIAVLSISILLTSCCSMNTQVLGSREIIAATPASPALFENGCRSINVTTTYVKYY